jgi:hypothetical protein
MNDDLQNLEREVASARARLASDLSYLCSADTYSEFKQDLKHEARLTFAGVVKDLKARAAANPAATLAIGAGVAWRLIERPPIAAALIGAGLLSLWRTTPVPANGHSERDYLSEGRERLKEQVGDLASSVREQAVEMAGVVTDQASEFADTTKEKVQRWSTAAASGVKGQAASVARRASGALDDARESVADVSAMAGEMVHRASSKVQDAVSDQNARDKILLSAAGLAVAAALGIAYQRRAST